MSSVFPCPTFCFGYQAFDANGKPLNAGQIITYANGTTTPLATYTTSAGNVANPTTITLGVDGRPPNEIWLAAGSSYTFDLLDSLGNLIKTYPGIPGINDIANIVEWIPTGLTPVFVSTTSFSLTGNLTALLTPNLRTKSTNTGGAVYSTIISATYASGPNTTTFVVLNDSPGALDAGLSAVSYSFLNSTNDSIPRSIPAYSIGGYATVENLALAFSVGSSALTCNVQGRNLTVASTANPIRVPFRDATLATGDYNVRTITAALSLVIPSTSTQGHASGNENYLFWYLLDNAGTVELAVSSKFFGVNGRVSTTLIAAASNTSTVMYSTTARTNVPFVCIAYTKDTQATAGTWAAVPTEVGLSPFTIPTFEVSVNRNAGVQTLTSGVPTKIQMNNEVIDTDGVWDGTTNFRYQPKMPGKYVFHTSGNLNSIADQQVMIAFIYLNGNPAFQAITSASGVNVPTVAVTSPPMALVPTDFVEFYFQQNSGGGLNTTNDATAAFGGGWRIGF